ncbi:hypothetical protein EXIGLDRAFT_39892 [Exidia glandulosa HHB12029]|uniref:Uncharacterized protein n=1 Tax=Exidia glandulosa HHB12029 TaxID=1314781 RepID=A0A165INS8_EXIGL|nr:hypothetical protein EXIGLDRAFT_39892 [Exidia glandulosa HHB12029]
MTRWRQVSYVYLPASTLRESRSVKVNNDRAKFQARTLDIPSYASSTPSRPTDGFHARNSLRSSRDASTASTTSNFTTRCKVERQARPSTRRMAAMRDGTSDNPAESLTPDARGQTETDTGDAMRSVRMRGHEGARGASDVLGDGQGGRRIVPSPRRKPNPNASQPRRGYVILCSPSAMHNARFRGRDDRRIGQTEYL